MRSLRRFLTLASLGGTIALVAFAAPTAGITGKVVFYTVTVYGRTGGGAAEIKVDVKCKGADRFKSSVGLAKNDLTNKTFFTKTLTGAVQGSKGSVSTTWRGKVPSNGLVVAAANTFCWDSHGSIHDGVGYRSLVYATCPSHGTCKATGKLH